MDRLEPLHRVQKPARYIGCEDGAATPDWSAAGPTSPIVAWLMTYPDTYEIGLPNQGLQILYEILNERPDAGRAVRRPVDRPRSRDASHRRAPVQRRQRRDKGTFDLLAFNLSAERDHTNLLNCIDLAGVPVRAADRRAHHPLVVIGGHCAYNPSSSRRSSTWSCSATARRPSAMHHLHHRVVD